ncbi:MAG TPA: arsenite methyltransferase [Acidimicrobiia bacterium]|nr:arsenite methyltransferase [Acidimicrobiia bacterium]
MLMDTKTKVAERYRTAALEMLDGGEGCCGGSTCGDEHYREGEVLQTVSAGVSLGCGNPTAVAELRPGDTVLDLGSGAGLDVIVSARRVAPGGKAIGLDMTPEMLDLARRHARQEGVDNIEFLHGHMEDIPLPADSIDVVISNCVVNLSTDKPRVFSEIARVLRPGGRIGIADIVAEDWLTPAERAQRGDWAGCIAGALSEAEYRQGLADAGFVDIDLVFTSSVAEGMHNAHIRATLP